jgi:hypothetical protein
MWKNWSELQWKKIWTAALLLICWKQIFKVVCIYISQVMIDQQQPFAFLFCAPLLFKSILFGAFSGLRFTWFLSNYPTILEVKFMKQSFTWSAVFADVSKKSIFLYVAKACAFSVGTACYALRSDLFPYLIQFYRWGQALLLDQHSSRPNWAKNY